MNQEGCSEKWDTLLVEANKAGVSAMEYWQMTPREVYAAIDAENWLRGIEIKNKHVEFENLHQELMWQNWHLALLMRQKTLPSLANFLDPPRTKDLSPEEAKERKAEFDQMKNALPRRLKEKPQAQE